MQVAVGAVGADLRREPAVARRVVEDPRVRLEDLAAVETEEVERRHDAPFAGGPVHDEHQFVERLDDAVLVHGDRRIRRLLAQLEHGAVRVELCVIGIRQAEHALVGAQSEVAGGRGGGWRRRGGGGSCGAAAARRWRRGGRGGATERQPMGEVEPLRLRRRGARKSLQERSRRQAGWRGDGAPVRRFVAHAQAATPGSARCAAAGTCAAGWAPVPGLGFGPGEAACATGTEAATSASAQVAVRTTVRALERHRRRGSITGPPSARRLAATADGGDCQSSRIIGGAASNHLRRPWGMPMRRLACHPIRPIRGSSGTNAR